MQSQDPFAIFETQQDPQINDMSKPKKKVHLDPMVQLESSIIAQKFNKNNFDADLEMNEEGSDNE